MKKLREFMNFDINAFLKDKKLIYLKDEPFYRYENGERTNEVEGRKYILVIMQDNTEYKDGQTHENEFEKLTVKVSNDHLDDNFSVLNRNDEVIIYNAKAVVFGNYQNQLSINAQYVFSKKQYAKLLKEQQQEQ